MWKHNNTAAIGVSTSRQHRGILGGRGRDGDGQGRRRGRDAREKKKKVWR